MHRQKVKVCIAKKQKFTPRKARRKYALVHSDHASKTEVLTERYIPFGLRTYAKAIPHIFLGSFFKRLRFRLG
jgi:hypothetical protein